MDELEKCCRLCLLIPTNCSNVLEDAFIKFKILKLLNVNIQECDKFSKLICDICYGTISNFFEYYEKAASNQEYLSKIYENDELEPEKAEKIIENYIEVKQEPEPLWTEAIEIFENAEVKKESNNNENKKRKSPPKKESSESECSSSDSEIKIKKRRRRISKPNKIKTEKEIEEALKKERDDVLIKDKIRLNCDICAKPADTFSELCRHYSNAHSQRGYVKCCQLKIFRKFEIIEHIKWHDNPELFRCSSCSTIFKSSKTLKHHFEIVHLSDDKRPFKCDKCPKAYAKEYQLKSHNYHHQTVTCAECGKELANRDSLKQHLFQIHSEEANMVCDICARIFKTKAAFDKHIKEHLGLSDPKLQCSICQRWFTDKACLKLHIRTQHLETDKEFFCNVCGKKAPNSNALKRHKEVHLEEKHKCTFCDRKFKRPIALKEHIAGHTGEPLYQCQYCPKTFNSNANMYSHKKKEHPREWLMQKMQQQTQLTANPNVSNS